MYAFPKFRMGVKNACSDKCVVQRGKTMDDKSFKDTMLSMRKKNPKALAADDDDKPIISVMGPCGSGDGERLATGSKEDALATSSLGADLSKLSELICKVEKQMKATDKIREAAAMAISQNEVGNQFQKLIDSLEDVFNNGVALHRCITT